MVQYHGTSKKTAKEICEGNIDIKLGGDDPRPRGYITIPYLHKSTGWSVGFISNPTSLYS